MIKALLISTCVTLSVFTGLNLAFPLPDRIAYSTVVTGSRNEILNAFLSPDEKWRMKIGLAEISPLLRTTIIRKEDRLFYHHSGVNPLSLARAAFMNIIRMKRTSGASTITMQVARALDPAPRNYANKIKEIFRAWQLEWKYSKDEILELYCNLLPYGGNIEGVKSAALLYFDKEPDHLSLAEIVALCVIPNRPSSLVPGRHNVAIVEARNKWLRKFEKDGVFTKSEIADAITEPFNATRHAVPNRIPHLARRYRNSREPAVRTSIDINMQQKIEKLTLDHCRTLKMKNIRNAAVLVIDNRTRKVLAYLGSSDFGDTAHAGQVDGVHAVRQPGSTLKPLLYGMCIDRGLITPKAVVPDVNVNYGGYAPENYDRKFNGHVTMEYALAHSLNVPAVRMLNSLGTRDLVTALSSCNFVQVRKDNRKLGLSMILGGCGASLYELAGLYSAFANGGEYTQISPLAGDVSRGSFRVLSPAAAFMINETLSKINRPDFPLSWQSTERMPRVAWKTGTSYGRRDAWSIGYNEKYTVAVWAGNFNAEGSAELSGAETATPLLFKIFNTIDYDGNREWFSPPPDCEIRKVCPETGMPPAIHCEHAILDFFIPMVSASAPCNNMSEIMISADGRISYCKSCMPPNGYRKKWFRIISPEMQAYYDGQDITYEKLPLHNPACEKVFQDGQPMITSPHAGMEYLISKSDPEPLQLRCRAGNDVGLVYWYVNNRFLKSGEAGQAQYFLPEEGPVKISCTDDKGRNRDVWIKVKYVDL